MSLRRAIKEVGNGSANLHSGTMGVEESGVAQTPHTGEHYEAHSTPQAAHGHEHLEHPQAATAHWNIQPLSEAKTVLIIGRDSATRAVLSTTLRDRLNYRVVEAFTVEEAQYLAVVEERIHLLVMDLTTLQHRDLEFARWFRSAVPRAKMLVAADSLWELQCDDGIWEQVLVAKSYTQTELVSSVRRIVG